MHLHHSDDSEVSSNGTGADPADTRLVIRPNVSLTWDQARYCLWFLSAAILASGVVLAVLGYWVVLPFSVLEAISVALALYLSQRAGLYREVVTLHGDNVRVEFGIGQAERMLEFNRLWLRVHLESPRSRLHSSRLWLSCAGVNCELGRCLADEEREALAKRLRALVGHASGTVSGGEAYTVT